MYNENGRLTVNIPKYSVLEMKSDTHICTEEIASGPNRFRIFQSADGCPVSGHQQASNLLRTQRGKTTVSVDEKTGEAKITKGDQTVIGRVDLLMSETEASDLLIAGTILISAIGRDVIATGNGQITTALGASLTVSMNQHNADKLAKLLSKPSQVYFSCVKNSCYATLRTDESHGDETTVFCTTED